MKFIFLSVAVLLGTISLAVPTGADPLPEATQVEPAAGEAADLLIPSEQSTESFEYASDQLDQLSTEINQGAAVDAEDEVLITRPTQDVDAPGSLVIINSDRDITEVNRETSEEKEL